MSFVLFDRVMVPKGAANQIMVAGAYPLMCYLEISSSIVGKYRAFSWYEYISWKRLKKMCMLACHSLVYTEFSVPRSTNTTLYALYPYSFRLLVRYYPTFSCPFQVGCVWFHLVQTSMNKYVSFPQHDVHSRNLTIVLSLHHSSGPFLCSDLLCVPYCHVDVFMTIRLMTSAICCQIEIKLL